MLTSKKLDLQLSFKKYKKFLGLPFEKILENMKIKKTFLKELGILKKDFFLAIYTSKSKKRTNKIISKYKIFDDCITIDDVKKGKPMPEGLLKIIKKFNIKKKDAIYVGDSIYDYQCARKANIKYLHAKWGYERSEKTEKLINILSFNEIKKFL